MQLIDLSVRMLSAKEEESDEALSSALNALHDSLLAGLAAWQAPPPAMASGYWKLYIDHVLQADQGCDLDFLVGQRGAAVPKDNH